MFDRENAQPLEDPITRGQNEKVLPQERIEYFFK